LHYIDPHDPYLPHPDMMDKPEPPGRFNGSRIELSKMDKLPAAELTEADKARIDYLYSGEIKYCDYWVGKLLAGIYELDPVMEKKTLLVLTADHGEGLWDHRTRAHGQDLYEEQIHIPLIIRYPGMTKEESGTIDVPISLVDIAPSILALCGIPKPEQFQGYDFTPLVRGATRGPSFDYIYSELDLDNRDFETIAKDGYKIIRNRAVPGHKTEAFQYYDLNQDPKEKNDLSGTPSETAWKGSLKKALKIWGDTVKADESLVQQISYEDLDEETLENLRALGYLGGKAPTKK
ncbi:MAG: sulfatase-like hydrolase/transferase, partial [Planctomycetes bacterium]|nr:sulfatase-like hydrolase/transferase [Planctomycetota bacterium]